MKINAVKIDISILPRLWVALGTFLFIFLSPVITFANPVDSVDIPIDDLACPNDTDYGICGWINSDLHNQFVTAMKKRDSTQAIDIWDQMSFSVDDSEEDTPINRLMEPLFGTYAPRWIMVFPEIIFAKKAYKWGILTLWKNHYSDFMPSNYSGYHISFMRYERDGILHIQNKTLVPLNSKQYFAYAKWYWDWIFEFERDMIWAFNKWKFNNKNVNTVYQKFVWSIRNVSESTNSVVKKYSLTKDYTISKNYRVYNWKVQYWYKNQSGNMTWADTDIDAVSITFSSPLNGKDKYGSFYQDFHIKSGRTGENIFFDPIGATATVASIFWTDGVTDTVYVFDSQGTKGSVNRLPWAKASTFKVIPADTSGYYSNNGLFLNFCKDGDQNATSWVIKGIDGDYCYGSVGWAQWNQIENLTERIK